MKPVTFLSLLLFSCHQAKAQPDFNLNFETPAPGAMVPSGWDSNFKSGGASGYLTALDSITVKEGKYALALFPNPDAGQRNFGACDRVIPAIYAGETIELRGFLKTEDVSAEGFAGLWMRIDGAVDMLQFDNMQARKITGTNDWTEYGIQLPLDEDAEKIHVGGLLVGSGKIWLDDLRLFIDGKPIEQAPAKTLKTYPAALDTVFKGGSGIQIERLSPEQIRDLALTGQIWGFLKYHHPGIAEGKFNWDFELFRVLPDILASTSTAERDARLSAWIDKLGKVPVCKKCTSDLSGEYKMRPDLAWIDQSGLDEKLSNQLHYILDNRHQGKHYYIALAAQVANPVFVHEDPYPDFVFPDAGYRLLALFRYWNIIQYFFPYKYAIEEDWNTVLYHSIAGFALAPDALAYRLELLKLIARIHDTHANLWVRDSFLTAYKGRLFTPFQVKFIEDQVVVTGFYNAELAAQSDIHIGDVILSIDGKEPAELVKERLPIYPASNYPTQLRNIARDLLRGNAEQVTLVLQRAGARFEKTINRTEAKSLSFQIDGAYPAPPSVLLPPDIGYINLGNFDETVLTNFRQRFKDTRGIIIDIRNYPSQFVVFTLGKLLRPGPAQFVKFSYGDIDRPGLFHYTEPLMVGESEPDYFYPGKVVILVNEMTQSQAEYTTMALRTAPDVTVVGSTTAGADGNVSPFFLPGNLRTMISGIGVFYPDGGETQRVGILPDIEVRQTIKGVREGRDEVLERAVEVIQLTKK